ncbi:hypothetical protein TVAG_077310 [Trichomonas vaginalis G3]|uniref:Uncharacterized protein n=1 Tax=Trichomonas vaginalis (strain ATCC PRA-98 / G3) TaxID=412133 RepID=A2E2T9_TRIV3|nr:hypothetical protein TVAGG3_0896720 [Trichomonas vaginalis G3]EAY12994.1 hypothetical protein TVAG_077310 [Trichomonas vaginalis G3]KAI5503128.1 hypothetical protein TVAGG3_0896720 [Trichomonas vaginalis G3]|eukprot:XP_001325217.1 hypothetical protein [Trichomonas vaginalis G3]
MSSLDKENIFTSQLELVSLHVIGLFDDISSSFKPDSFASLLEFLPTINFDTNELNRCIDLAAIAGSEYPIKSFQILDKMYGYSQFTQVSYPEDLSTNFCCTFLHREEWENEIIKYLMMYLFARVFASLISNIVRRIEKFERSDMDFLMGSIYNMNIDASVYPEKMQQIIKLLAEPWCSVAAEISVHAPAATTYNILYCELDSTFEISYFFAVYCSQVKIFDEESEINKDLLNFLKIIETRFESAISDSSKRELLALLLYNVFGQLLSVLPELKTNEGINNIYNLILVYIEKDSNVRNSIKVITLLSSFLDKPIEYLYSPNLNPKIRLEAMTIAVRGQNFTTDVQIPDTISKWEYSPKANEICRKCIQYINNSMKDYIQFPKEFHGFIIQISHVSITDFQTLLKSLQAKKDYCASLFFDEMSYFLMHGEYKDLQSVAKRIAVEDNIDRYVKSFNLIGVNCKSSYKYTSLTNCNNNPLDSYIGQNELSNAFISFKETKCNMTIDIPTDISMHLADWRRKISTYTKQIYYLEKSSFVKADDEKQPDPELYDDNKSLIYSLINYITFAYQSGVNEMPSLKSLISLLVHPNIDIGNKALWALQYSILKLLPLSPIIISTILKLSLSKEFLTAPKITLNLSALCIIIPVLRYQLSFQAMADIEKLIFYGLLQQSFAARTKALELVEIIQESSQFAKFIVTNRNKISELGQKRAAMFVGVGLSKELSDIDLSFKDIANSSNNALYFIYFAAFCMVLHKKDQQLESQLLESIDTCPDTLLTISNGYFYCLTLCFRAICSSIPDTIMNTAYGVINPNQNTDFYFALAISHVQMKDQDAIFRNLANHHPRGQAAACSLAYILSLNDEFCTMQAEKYTPGFKYFHDNLLKYYRKGIVPEIPSHTIKNEYFKTADSLMPLFSISMFLAALGNIFKKLIYIYNSPRRGIFGLCYSPPTNFEHECCDTSVFTFIYNMTSIDMDWPKMCAEYALTQWVFFGNISDEMAESILPFFIGTEFSTNILASHFSTLLRKFVDQSVNLSSRLKAICNQFDITMRTSEKICNEQISFLFGKLLAVGFTAISFGDESLREKGFNLLLCITSGTYSQGHSQEETERFIAELEEYKSGVCSSYSDIDLSVSLLSQCLSNYFTQMSELFISAVFHLEKEFHPQAINRRNSVVLANIDTQERGKDIAIPKLLNLLQPWLKFADLSSKSTLINNCPRMLSCYTPYTFISSLLSLRCADPLSSAVAAVIAGMASSSPNNALTTFANLLYVINVKKDLYPQTLSSLTLVLTVMSSTLSPHLLAVTRVESWFALNASYIKQQFDFKKTMKVSIEILTQLIDEGSDDILAHRHLILAFALITGPIFKDKCEELMSAITKQAINANSKHLYLNFPQTHADQLTRGIVSGHRPEQIVDWYSSFSQEQMVQVKDMLLKWALCCLDLPVSASAFALLNVLQIPLNEDENEAIAMTLIRFAQSLHNSTTTVLDENGLNYLMTANNGFISEKLYGIVIISSGLMLLKSNLNMKLLEITSSFLACTDDELSPIYSASLLSVKEAFEKEELLTSMDFSNILLIILTNINSESSLSIVRRVLCVCFVKKPQWCQILLPFIQFCLAPLVWNQRGDKSKYQSVFAAAEDTSLKMLINTTSDKYIRTFYWHAVTELSQKNISDAAAFFAKITKYGDSTEAQASYLLLSAMLDKFHVSEKTPGIQIALLQAVNTRDEFLVDSATVFLKSAVRAKVTTISQVGSMKKTKEFPEIQTSVYIENVVWNYYNGAFDSYKTCPPLQVVDLEDANYIPEKAKIEPFSTWYNCINVLPDLQSVLNIADLGRFA